MNKVKVTDREFKALELFTRGHSVENRIQAFIQLSNVWTNTYLPLKEMGLEKFVMCLINGYELDFDVKHKSVINNTGSTKSRISITYNYDTIYNLKNENSPIYFEIKTGHQYCYTGLTVNQTKQLIDALENQLNHLKQIRSDI